MLAKFTNYIQESQKELKKVVWPTRKEVTKHTTLVIIISIATAIFLGGVDYLATVIIGTFFS